MSLEKILITGSAGFIGSNLVRSILYSNKKVKVVGLDRLENAASMNNVYINKSHEFYIADTCDEHILKRIFEITIPDIVVHLGFSKKPEHLVSSNVISTQNVINECIKHKIYKMIYVSSYDVYEDKLGIKETDIIKHDKGFGTSCLIAEDVIKSSGIDYTIFRTGDVFGPRSPNGFITKLYKEIKNKKVSLSNSANIRDFTYVDDLSYAIDNSFTNGSTKNQTYNFSYGNDYVDAEIVDIIGNSLELNDYTINNIKEKPYMKNLDCSKIKKLGLKHNKPFKERIKTTIMWLESNKWILI